MMVNKEQVSDLWHSMQFSNETYKLTRGLSDLINK